MRINSPKLNIMYKACMKASKSLIRDFGEIENLQVSSKGPGDFVSSADKRTEKIIIDELLKAHPDFGILSEEVGVINEKNKINIGTVYPPQESINNTAVFKEMFVKTRPIRHFQGGVLSQMLFFPNECLYKIHVVIRSTCIE